MAEIVGNMGIFAQAFPNKLIPQVVELMIEEWPNSSRPSDNPLENRITNRFVGHLQNVMREYQLPLFKFRYREKIPNSNADSETAELDIVIDSFSCHPDAIFVVECKRLNVHSETGFKSCAGAYIGNEGMGCFISGQYKTGGNIGGMLGYVMSRTIGDAIESIDKQFSIHHEDLLLQEPHNLRESTIIPNNQNVRQTTHILSDGNFEILHMFLAY